MVDLGRPPGWPQKIYIGGQIWDVDEAIAAGMLELPEGESQGVGTDIFDEPVQKQYVPQTLARTPEAQKILDLLVPQDPEGVERGGFLPFRTRPEGAPQDWLSRVMRQSNPFTAALPPQLEWALPEFLRDTIRGAVSGWDQMGIAGRSAVGLPTPEGPVGLPLDLTMAMLDLMGGGPSRGADNALGMFVGTRGIRMAPNTPETLQRRRNLGEAMTMEGRNYNRDDIWQKARWGRDPLGNWFTELTDPSAYTLSPNYPRLSDNSDTLHLPLYNTDVKPLTPYRVPVSDLFQYPDLYQMYPDMRNYTARGMTLGGSLQGMAAGINPEKKLLFMGPGSPERVRSSGAHELQHIVADQEGWPGGSSVRAYLPEGFQSDYGLAQQIYKIYSDELRALGLNTVTLQRALTRQGQGRPLMRHQQQQLDTARQSPAWPHWLDALKDKMALDAQMREATDKYYTGVGEAQARNTQYRLENPEAYNYTPWETLQQMKHPVNERDLHLDELTYDVRANMNAPRQIDTPEFMEWFGDSKIVDADGEPLVVYHGTPAGDITEFSPRGGEVWFTSNPDRASTYAEWGQGDGAAVYPVYLSLNNPAPKSVVDRMLSGNQMKEMGYDGYIEKVGPPGNEETYYVVFEPTQIKSAIGNSGAFDPSNPSILSANPRTNAPAAIHAGDIPDWFDNWSELPDDVAWAFTRLGDAQRGAPEHAMLRVHRALGGGVLNPVVEHVGDLTHRMTHNIGYNQTHPDIILEKTEKALHYLDHPYGFEREMDQNIASNYRYQAERGRNISEDMFRQDLDNALSRYADEHSKLKVYNRPQWLAREAAVALGRKDWDRARELLHELDFMARREDWEDQARLYSQDENGNLLEYPWSEE